MLSKYVFCVREDFYEFDPKGKESENKNKWMGLLYQTKKLSHSKRNHQQNKKATN